MISAPGSSGGRIVKVYNGIYSKIILDQIFLFWEKLFFYLFIYLFYFYQPRLGQTNNCCNGQNHRFIVILSILS